MLADSLIDQVLQRERCGFSYTNETLTEVARVESWSSGLSSKNLYTRLENRLPRYHGVIPIRLEMGEDPAFTALIAGVDTFIKSRMRASHRDR